MKSDVMNMLVKLPSAEVHKVLSSSCTDKIDYAYEWINDLFYKGVTFAKKYGFEYEIITFYNNKLWTKDVSPPENGCDLIEFIFVPEAIKNLHDHLAEQENAMGVPF